MTFPTFARALRELCAARDRRLSYGTARRMVEEGYIVVCDRFPLPEIELMDGPVLDRVLGGSPRGAIARLLMRLEQAQYRSIAPPEALIVLRVDPEVAVRRRLEGNPDLVRARAREIWEYDWRATPARVIDAGRPPDEVVAAAKSIVAGVLESLPNESPS